jgi:hypothetical protein
MSFYLSNNINLLIQKELKHEDLSSKKVQTKIKNL